MNKKNYILIDNHDDFENLLPLTFTRPISELRVGILTIKEKWEKYLNAELSYATIDYLQKKYLLKASEENIYINSTILPEKQLIEEINSLEEKQVLLYNETIIATNSGSEIIESLSLNNCINYKQIKTKVLRIKKINFPWDLFSLNGEEINADFALLTSNKISEKLSSTNTIIGDGKIFLEKGAKCEASVLNTTNGPIYIGENAEIMEGSLIRGPFVLCNDSTVKMGAKIYGPTTIGPHSKVGGEINNSIIIGFSNKAHDGFIGQSIIGEWCNLGADTNASNLKNTYANVKVWNYRTRTFIDTGLQFCGLIMGDHSKCGINTMFNTGTVVGVSANIFGAGYPRNYIPSFSWGGATGLTLFKFEKAIESIQSMMKRRNKFLSEIDIEILQHIYNNTIEYNK